MCVPCANLLKDCKNICSGLKIFLHWLIRVTDCDLISARNLSHFKLCMRCHYNYWLYIGYFISDIPPVWHVYFQLFPINQQSPETAPSPAVSITKCSERSSSSQCHDPDCIFEEVNRLCNEKTFVVVPAFDTRDAKLAFEAVAGAGEGLHLCNPTISV